MSLARPPRTPGQRFVLELCSGAKRSRRTASAPPRLVRIESVDLVRGAIMIRDGAGSRGAVLHALGHRHSAPAPRWSILHVQGVLIAAPGHVVFDAGLLIPWIDVTALGWMLGAT